MMKCKYVILLLFFVHLSSQRREKRYVYVNPTSPITLGFILNLPIALALPTLVFDGRSLDIINTLNMTGDSPEELYYDIKYSDPLGKLGMYFSYMEIPTLSCQERLICEIAANPDTYSPATEIILKEIRQKFGPLKKSNDSLMWRYMVAAREGFSSTADECGTLYSKCPAPAYKLINMPVIKVWQYISSKLHLKIL